ncbi:hypothetical protein ACIA6C_27985 [Streptomyces sp. NPDC051578]|uniref:hypothetical protein n=1 Tax=Streptomyces sp. NPDC051578 TaxID=3365662 RepID=UPI003790471F
MGMLDQAVLQQAKKAQGETNQRLEALIAEQQRTNQLLTHLIGLLTPQSAAPAAASWGSQSR